MLFCVAISGQNVLLPRKPEALPQADLPRPVGPNQNVKIKGVKEDQRGQASLIEEDQRGQASLIEFSQLVSYDFAFQGAT